MPDGGGAFGRQQLGGLHRDTGQGEQGARHIPYQQDRQAVAFTADVEHGPGITIALPAVQVGQWYSDQPVPGLSEQAGALGQCWTGSPYEVPPGAFVGALRGRPLLGPQRALRREPSQCGDETGAVPGVVPGRQPHLPQAVARLPAFQEMAHAVIDGRRV
ncbi:hypothetical protein [Streptomyces sp. KMM 9044]|uniref:hypothetical protein n=1 Tax=Streptomyces sp. KMM 9044 TaxID=2744474 RepID=UPI002150A585|nr:hypothetical protein [Streptomyces sp. KMM 9044]WAX77103.1 hypothetical protein HUV60_004900 [Streptomyces sp. KMM 9044]